jgi:hypothetical protein
VLLAHSAFKLSNKARVENPSDIHGRHDQWAVEWVDKLRVHEGRVCLVLSGLRLTSPHI